MRRTILSVLSLLMGLTVLGATSATAQVSSLPSGVVAAYYFDEGTGTVTADASGSGHDGTLVNGPVWTEGFRGTAVQLDGVNDYMSIPSTLYSLSGGTLSLRFKKTGSGTGTNTIIGSWGGSGNQRAPTFSIPSTTLMWEFGSLYNQSTGQSIVNDRWYHVVMTYDSSFNVRVYLDGALVASGTSANPGGFFNQVDIGHYINWGTIYFQGVLDEVFVWNRPLSADEVTQVYTNSGPPPPDTEAPVVTNVSAGGITSMSATISWTTNEPADSQVEYGTAPGVYTSSTPLNSSLVTLHSVSLSGLTSTTSYYYRVHSADAAGNLSVSGDFSFTTTEPSALPSGLVAAYYFDEGSGTVTSDASGGGHDGTLVNGPVWTQGFQGTAVQLDGVNDYVSIPSTVYSLSGGTLSLRFKKTGSGTGTNTIIGSWGGTGNQRAPTFSVPSTTLMWEFGSLYGQSTGQSIVNDRWYHVVMTYDSSFNVRVYLDGALVASGTSANPGGFFNRVDIGHYVNWGTIYFQGVVDEVFVWNRALSADEVSQLYTNSGADTTPPSTPSGLNATSVTQNQVTLAWSASSDPESGVAHYNVYRDNVQVGQPILPSYVDAGVASGQTYRYGVSAVNGVGLESSRSTSLDVSTSSPGGGAAGPILLITNASNPFTLYYSEILRAEGLNAFNVLDISVVSATILQDYDVVILGEMQLSSEQATMLADWVNAGGNLVAMRPDKKLAGLLGLTDASSTFSNGYLLVDTSRPPGFGIVNSTIQFHGTADLYNLSGATAIATLYSTDVVPMPNPAVTLRTVGANGGQAAAFTYDLARSIVYTRQGNPAWAGQKRTNVTIHPVESTDLFYGAASYDPQPDWVNLQKVAIPQADEQQRLLANLILSMNFAKKPLPRFWYFPRGEKAVVIMTGDDHTDGQLTAARLDRYIAFSPSGCNVDNWECVRSSSYLYPPTPTLSDAQAAAYTSLGFEIGLHLNTNCDAWTPSSLETFYDTQLAAFASTYPSIPLPSSERTHCVSWSDWVTHAIVELQHGSRLDTNYYYWPDSWVLDRPGFFTGSGMPMRFADVDGTLIDVYQATTQMTDESGQSYPFTIDTLLDRALGAEGYYGAFTVNAHNDKSSAVADAIVASAQTRGVPIVSGRQMLKWLDGRGGSSFDSLVWANNVLTFTVTVGSGANGLQVMLPATASSGGITALNCGGNPVAYTVENIKGIDYALFPATDCAYEALYNSTGTGALTITNVSAGGITTNSATISWTTNVPADSQVEYGTDPGVYTSSTPRDSSLVNSHSVSLSGLTSSTTYYYRARSADAAANLSVSGDFSFTTAQVSSLPSGVVAAYYFDEGSGAVTSDASGGGHNGTLVNGPVWTDGFRGTAIQLDGVNDYVSIPATLYSLSGGTLSLRFKKTGNGTGTNTIIGSWGGSGNQRAPTFSVPSTTLMWEFGSLWNQSTGQSIVNDRWYHVVMTYDSSFNVRVYLDGALVAGGTSANPGGFLSEVDIGHYINWGTIYFQGVVDEVFVWNRALSAQEVQDLFND